MRAGSVCRHLKIAGRVAIVDCIQPTSLCLSQVATQPFPFCNLLIAKGKRFNPHSGPPQFNRPYLKCSGSARCYALRIFFARALQINAIALSVAIECCHARSGLVSQRAARSLLPPVRAVRVSKQLPPSCIKASDFRGYRVRLLGTRWDFRLIWFRRSSANRCGSR